LFAAIEARLMRLHFAIVVTCLLNFIPVIIEQETSWRIWYLSDTYPHESLNSIPASSNGLKLVSTCITAVLELMLIYMYY
jgi:hypothetical protein